MYCKLQAGERKLFYLRSLRHTMIDTIPILVHHLENTEIDIYVKVNKFKCSSTSGSQSPDVQYNQRQGRSTEMEMMIISFGLGLLG